MSKRDDSFDDPRPLNGQLSSYIGRTADMRLEGEHVGYLHLSRDVVVSTTGSLWWKVRHPPREVLRWDVVLTSGEEPTEYLQGEYDEVDTGDELTRDAFALRGESYALTWLPDAKAAVIFIEFFSAAGD